MKVLLHTAALLSISARLVAAQSITTIVTAGGSPTIAVVAASPTGRGYCEFYIDHWDCDASRPEATQATATVTSAAPSIAPFPVGQICELHVDHWHCDGPATATAAGAQATSAAEGECHQHGDHLHCEGVSESVEQDHDHSGHSHAGHSHGPSSEYGCSLAPPSPYNTGLHVATIFILLASSAVGTFLPILLYSGSSGEEKKRWGWWAEELFFICRHFGTGVIISTAFVHLLSHAMLYWANECIGELSYEAPAPAIAMAAVWVVFLVDFLLLRSLRRRSGMGSTCTHDHARGEEEGEVGKRTSNSTLSSSEEGESEYAGLSYAQAKVAEWDVIAIEAGIIFHSILIGVTLGVATGAGFVALLVAITFHQLFEGLALGSRLSLLTWRRLTYKIALGTGYVLTTPVGVAIGIGVRRTFNGNNAATLITLGTLHAVSAGILLYTALVELLSGDFIHNRKMQESGLGRCVAAVASLTVGAVAMSVLAKWA